MALILNIDTAAEHASISIASDGKVLSLRFNDQQRDHSSWLHPAIADLFIEAKHAISDIDAVAVNGGPGSYTGLRVSMAAAKGICFALNKPIIVIGSLEILTRQALVLQPELRLIKAARFCPMIDARRMEVYMIIYDSSLNALEGARAVIIDEDFLSSLSTGHPIYFFGPGCKKIQQMLQKTAFCCIDLEINDLEIASMSDEYFRENRIFDAAMAEPIYIKELYSTSKNTQTP